MASFFSEVPLAPPNSILGVALECKKDPFANKIDLTIGAYRDDNGKPQVLECVREAEKIIYEQGLDHEYLAQDGLPEFNAVSQKLMFGDEASAISENRVYTIQGLSGTGSLRLACEFIAAFMPNAVCYYPDTTWPNHPALLKASGVRARTYRYLDSTGCALDFPGLVEDLRLCPPGSIVLLHLCAHNPTGVDPTEEQWTEILEIIKSNKLLPFFDNAYQGFVSGDPINDALPARIFSETGLEMIAACSFAKNFGLYGQRIGALHVVSSTPESLPAIASQLRVISRTLYSTCPAHGARIVSLVLGDPERKALWLRECKGMADRIAGVRALLYEALKNNNVKGTWEHVVLQRGMFSYTGIPAWAVSRLREEFHIYMLENGRISLAGLNVNNVERFALALAEILGMNE